MNDKNLRPYDGNLYVDSNDNPPLPPSDPNYVNTSGEPHFFPYSLDGTPDANGITIYERVLADWLDVTTLPRSTTTCSNRCGPLCCGWTVKWKHYYNSAILRVHVASYSRNEIENAVKDCLKIGAIAGLVAIIATGGSAASSAASSAIKACLIKKFGNDLLSVSIYIHGEWR